MKIGLFFGSFNPIHQGHLDIANYMAEFTNLDEIWFIVSPHNPLKEKDTLISDFHRLEMVRRAVAENNKIKKTPIDLQNADIEFDMAKPSYTINTLNYIKDKFSGNEFALIIGSDNLSQFDKWKCYEQILENYELYVYPRTRSPKPRPSMEERGKSQVPSSKSQESDCVVLSEHHNVKLINAPLIKISSEEIRKLVREGKETGNMLPGSVCDYIKKMRLYIVSC